MSASLPACQDTAHGISAASLAMNLMATTSQEPWELATSKHATFTRVRVSVNTEMLY